MTTPPKEKYLTTREAGELIGKGSNMILKLCQSGRLIGAEKMGGCWLVPRDSILKYRPNKRGRKSIKGN